MEYKVLIRVFVPEIEEEYEMYIPINKTVGEITKSLGQLITAMSGIYPPEKNLFLYNRHSSTIYSRNLLIRETDIRNGTELVVIS